MSGASGVASAAPATPWGIIVVPNSITPKLSGGCGYGDQTKLCYYVKGKADPGITVVVTARDPLRPEIAFKTQTTAASQSDPGAGTEAGDWSTSFNVTDLGTHGGIYSSAEGRFVPSAQSSTLAFTAAAKAADGTLSSESAPVAATKVAATPKDITPPKLTQSGRQNPPSGKWCRRESCRNQSSLGFSTLGLDGMRPDPCSGSDEGIVGVFTGANTFPCAQGRSLVGSVEDNVEGSYGFASEIGDIAIVITRVKDNVIFKEFHPAIRRGTYASYNVALSIGDYEDDTQYKWQLFAYDAQGNLIADPPSGTFTVTP